MLKHPDPKIQAELDKTQAFADKIQIKHYAEVQRNLTRVAAQTAKEAAAWLTEAAERITVPA